MKYYIVTKLENWKAHNELRDKLNALGHECTYDWTVHGPVYKEGLERIREIAQLEMKGVMDADLTIVLWPGGRGTHVEMGMALILAEQTSDFTMGSKGVCLVSDVEDHHHATTETCAFYHHPKVSRFRTVKDMLLLIKIAYR